MSHVKAIRITVHDSNMLNTDTWTTPVKILPLSFPEDWMYGKTVSIPLVQCFVYLVCSMFGDAKGHILCHKVDHELIFRLDFLAQTGRGFL